MLNITCRKTPNKFKPMTGKPPKKPKSASSEFITLMADVIPLKDRNKLEKKPEHKINRRIIKQPEKTINPRFISQEFLSEQSELNSFVRNGVTPKVLRKLKHGFWRICAELDLHGATSEEAQYLLSDFLFSRNLNGICVRIIHGRALGSSRGPVLKRLTRAWLLEQKEVLAYCEAPANQGGEGAVLVLLKNRQPD